MNSLIMGEEFLFLINAHTAGALTIDSRVYEGFNCGFNDVSNRTLDFLR